ncbi:MAG: hypothetical protein V1843_01915, partial [bacterium]
LASDFTFMQRYMTLTRWRATGLVSLVALGPAPWPHAAVTRLVVKFLDTIERVNIHFSDIFQTLFEGGEARISLSDTENPLECGIDIMARPQGKKWLNLSLLSGGERSLTALAIMFGLLKTHPSPFCFLDEADAALDDANTLRFNKLLKDYSKETQVITITHNKRTMAIAGTLYGITMEEPGISKLVSMKLEKVAN